MKKIVRVVWISILTGMAFLVACTCHNKMTRAERKQLEQERDSIYAEMKKTDPDRMKDDPEYLLKAKQQEYAQFQRIYEIETLLGDEHSTQSKSTLDNLKQQIETIQNELFMTVYGPPVDYEGIARLVDEKSRRELRLEQIKEILSEREGEKLYGSPDVIEKRRKEKMELQTEAEKLEKEIDSLNFQIEWMQRR